eukprot:TRINITY_DN7301_c2_g2_i2.p1 TRINITY_DN7301_c2_g2~~TRINITY_DN7301_c2_g2_i2.p1  ORF type:complete len:734 (+),score=75.58 TRINITY_DN7301_c2_g2_i2:295-2496(+)
MAELSIREPLLLNQSVESGFTKTKLLASFAKWVLKILMWVIFVAWAALIFFYPSEFVQGFYQKLVKATEGSVFGITGSVLLVFSAPILTIAILSIVYIIAFPIEYYEKGKKFPRFRLWTFPTLTEGPFGVVSAAELVGILLFAAYIMWAVSAYTIQIARSISELTFTSKEKGLLMLEFIGLRLGLIGLFCLAFLFLPVARGSILLRLIDIPFEHATRYHVWLGHLTMALFTFHGVCYIVAWSLQGRLLREILQWRNVGIANLPGVISLTAGILMWVTSLHPVRKGYFELFFYTHQLYVIFVVFLALHVGDFIFSIAAGGIFLFILDRFLRFCQSRTSVDIISAKCLPCGTVELVFSKPKNLRYNALSFIFIQLREFSWLQWHPFSVSSSPLDGAHHISILIKVLGEWTAKLRDSIETQKGSPYHSSPLITAYVEGPYGHESPYHLSYENLILVAGGIGISPFVAILSDILHRTREKKPCLPKNLLIVWAVKRSKELSLLLSIDAESICPSFSDKLNLDIQAYVTQESDPPLEDGHIYKNKNSPSFTVTNGSSMSSLVGTGNNIWAGIYVVSSIVGFVIILGLMNAFYINPLGISYWWFKGLLLIVCMVASVVIFGGLVVMLWNLWEGGSSSYEKCMDVNEKNNDLTRYDGLTLDTDKSEASLASSSAIKYGCRPDFKAIFNYVSESWGNVDVGVIVCGPPPLQSSVAKECRSQNLRGRWNQAIYHFNSHSFDL